MILAYLETGIYEIQYISKAYKDPIISPKDIYNTAFPIESWL